MESIETRLPYSVAHNLHMSPLHYHRASKNRTHRIIPKDMTYNANFMC